LGQSAKLELLGQLGQKATKAFRVSKAKSGQLVRSVLLEKPGPQARKVFRESKATPEKLELYPLPLP
jgi:hypothetical protein